MSILRLPHLSKTKTGIYGYRRRVPDSIRRKLGKTEIVKSFGSADPKSVKPTHAAFHAYVERKFAEAKGSPVRGCDLIVDDGNNPPVACGLPSNKPEAE